MDPVDDASDLTRGGVVCGNPSQALRARGKQGQPTSVKQVPQLLAKVNLIVPCLLAPAVTVGERRELWILPPFFFGLFFCL